MGIKPVNVTFDIDGQGNLVLSGRIRVLTQPGDNVQPVQAALVTSDGVSEPVTPTLEPETGSSVYGHTSYYSLSATPRQDAAYTALEITLGGAQASSPTSFPLQSTLFVVPSKTSLQEGSKVINFTVAAMSTTSSSPVAVSISAPVRQPGTLAPRITRHDAAVVESDNTASGIPPRGYRFWEGSVDVGAVVTGAVAVAVTAMDDGGGVVHDVLYLSAGVAGW
ncbi:hypothetical protein DHEL01_v202619 [Diaporthe helianthi]|uniref:Uncharacterized protein n=1 Tax=Diaporthe helianthi TaxID=158607 RepID=A0A2P5I910_DIAHE|nr:hypothetical protein DHEL01_v202619 [Diaporthe helianthi]